MSGLVIRKFEPVTQQPEPKSQVVWGISGFPTETPPEKVLLGNGWIRRGDCATFISTAGAGKSVGITQAAIAWGLGLPYFGIEPSRPLRVLLFSGEDDEVTLGQCREGFIDHAEALTGRCVTPGEIDTLDAMLRVDFSREHVGDRFHAHLAGLLTEHPADLVLVNPLLSYVGGDIVKEASPWLRSGLLPLLQRHDCAAIVAHHTNRMARDSWDNTDDVYSGIGGGEIANIPRSVLTLRPTKDEGLFVLRVGKRTTTGWRDSDGNFTASFYLRRSNDPSRPAWLPVPHAEAEEIIGSARGSTGRPKKCTTEDVFAVLGKGAASRAGLIEELRRRTGCGETAAKDAINDARPDLHEWTVPNPQGGRAIVWFCLPEHAGNFNGRK